MYTNIFSLKSFSFILLFRNERSRQTRD